MLDPDALTATCGVQPARSFHVGEAWGRSAALAGWEWTTPDAGDDAAPMDLLLQVLGPHAAHFRLWADRGCQVSLTVVGEVRGDLIYTAEEADRRGFDASKPFEPFLDVDRVGLSLEREAVQFLAAAGASYYTHIDVEYEPFGRLRDSQRREVE